MLGLGDPILSHSAPGINAANICRQEGGERRSQVATCEGNWCLQRKTLSSCTGCWSVALHPLGLSQSNGQQWGMH